MVLSRYSAVLPGALHTPPGLDVAEQHWSRAGTGGGSGLIKASAWISWGTTLA